MFERIEVNQGDREQVTNKLRASCFAGTVTVEDATSLVENQADVNRKNNYGESALHYASEKCSKEVVCLLLQHHALPNSQTNEGRVPLSYAVKKGRPDICRELLAGRADPGLHDSYGLSPWMLSSSADVEQVLAPGIKMEDIMTRLEVGATPFCDWAKSLAQPGQSLAEALDMLRLSELFFFEPVKLERTPQTQFLLRSWLVCGQLLERTAFAETALNREEKQLLRYLLLCMRGPQKNTNKGIFKWNHADNRESYRERCDTVVKGLFQNFEAQTQALRQEISECADGGDEMCKEFAGIPEESYHVPAGLISKWPEWAEAVNKGRLRMDLPGLIPCHQVVGGVRNIDDGASVMKSGMLTFLSLRRLDDMASVQEYSEVVQGILGVKTGRLPHAKLNTRCQVAYAKKANDKFHRAVVSLLETAKGTTEELTGITYMEAPSKKYARSWEKTLESMHEDKQRQKDAAMELQQPDIKTSMSLLSATALSATSQSPIDMSYWSWLHPQYETMTHCMHILDMNRGTIVADGASVREQIKRLAVLRRWLLGRTLEADGAAVLREKSGYAASPAPGGYFDIKLFVMFDLGSFTSFDGMEVPLRIVGELQLLLGKMLSVKERMHVAYEIQRGSYEWSQVATLEKNLLKSQASKDELVEGEDTQDHGTGS